MNQAVIVATLMLVVLAGCVSGPHESVVPEAALSPAHGKKAQRRRTLVVCMDGTANTASDRTNVRRIYDLASIQNRPDVLCFYDPGVGTGEFARLFGLAAGAGQARNVRDAAEFLSMHYQDGDRIYLIGFSRGAFCVQDLCGFLRVCGLPEPETPKPVRSKNLDTNDALKARAGLTKRRAAEAARLVGKTWENIYEKGYRCGRGYRGQGPNEVERLAKFWSQHSKGRRPVALGGPGLPIEAVVLFDPVNAVGTQFTTALMDPEGVEARLKIGHSHHSLALGPEINRAYFALSLDERRAAFTSSLPPSPVELARVELASTPSHCFMPKRRVILSRQTPEFVWFAGDHSDIGGGHEEKELSGLTLNWALSKIGAEILPESPSIRVYASPLGLIHDLKKTSWLWKIGNERVRREPFNSDNVKDPAFWPLGVNSEGWKMQLHWSVIERIKTGDYFPRPFRCDAYKYRKQASEKDPVPTGTLAKFPVTPRTD